MSLYKRKDSDTWWMSFNAKGRRLRSSTHYINRMVETLRPHILLLDEYYEKYGTSLEEIMRKAG